MSDHWTSGLGPSGEALPPGSSPTSSIPARSNGATGSSSGNGLQMTGVLVGLIGLVLTIMGYTSLSDELGDVSTAHQIQYLLATGLPSLVGAGLLFGVGSILQELRVKR